MQSVRRRRRFNNKYRLVIQSVLTTSTVLLLACHSVAWTLWWRQERHASSSSSSTTTASATTPSQVLPAPTEQDHNNNSSHRPLNLVVRLRNETQDHQNHNYDKTEGVVAAVARAFNLFQSPLPCYEPDPPKWYGRAAQQTPTTRGLLFVKPYKTASSTAAGIHLRIAKNLAKKNKKNQQFEICHARFDHTIASRMGFAQRDRRRRSDGHNNSGRQTSSSFLWTIVRDPTARAVSQFFHFVVGRHNVTPTPRVFRYALEHWNDYYLRVLSLVVEEKNANNKDPIQVVRNILLDYDFIAVTERFDESVVVLQMLLGLSLGDVLYLSAKHSGGYDDGGGKRHCTYIPPSSIVFDRHPEMRGFLESSAWKDEIIRWDQILYDAANLSLDKTIDETLGRPAFEQQLFKFREAQQFAKERCLSRAIFPCSENGEYNNITNCIWNDSGCGNDCLDEVATELGLW